MYLNWPQEDMKSRYIWRIKFAMDCSLPSGLKNILLGSCISNEKNTQTTSCTMFLVTYYDALQSIPAKSEHPCLTTDDNIHYKTMISDREHLYFKRSGLRKIFKNKYSSFEGVYFESFWLDSFLMPL